MTFRGMPETYLGDGLYASFDGYNIVLRTPRENGDHWVGLEPETWKALMRYQRQLSDDLAEGRFVP